MGVWDANALGHVVAIEHRRQDGLPFTITAGVATVRGLLMATEIGVLETLGEVKIMGDRGGV